MQDHKVTLSNGQILEIQELDGLLKITNGYDTIAEIRSGGVYFFPIRSAVLEALTAKIPTLEQFRASGRHCAELSKEVHIFQDVDYTAVGRVYMRGYYLESTETWRASAPEMKNIGDWSFCAGSQQLTGTLAEMEEKLYEYAKHDLI